MCTGINVIMKREITHNYSKDFDSLLQEEPALLFL